MTRRPFAVVTSVGKTVRTSTLEGYATKEAESRRQTEQFTKTDFGSTGLVAPPFDPEQLTQLLELNTYHYRACKTKARDAAGLGWEFIPAQQDEGEPDEEPQELKALREFFDGLAVPLTMALERAQMDFEAVGWGCVELVHEGHDPTKPLRDIVHIPAHSVRVHKDGNKYVQRRGRAKTWFRRPGLAVKGSDTPSYVNYKTGEESPDVETGDRATDLLLWVNYTPRSDYYGTPDVIPAMGAIVGDVARRDFNVAFFSNFGVPAYAVYITGDYEDEEILDDAGEGTGVTKLQEAIEEKLRELQGNPHSTLVLSIPSAGGGGEGGGEVKVEFCKLAVEVKDASFRLYRQDNRDEVLASHAVPAYRAAVTEVGSLGQNVAAETTEIYKRSVIEPRQTILELLVNRWVLPAFGVKGWTWKLNEIDTTDEAHEMEMLERLWTMGAALASEIRDHFAGRFGLDPDTALPEDEGAAPGEASAVIRQIRERILDRAEKAGLIDSDEREMFTRELEHAAV